MFFYLGLIGFFLMIGYGIYLYRYYIIRKLIRWIAPHIKTNEEIPEAELQDNIIEIPYFYQGQLYKVYLPYKKPRRNVIKFYLINNIGEEINITQQNGISYYVTAENLGGVGIISKKFDRVERKFSKNQIPCL